MGKPIPSGLPQNIFLSAAQLKFNGTDVGLVSGVKMAIKDLTTAITSDQFGKSNVDHRYVGQTCTVEIMLDEFTVEKMKIAYPQATFITDGSVSRISWGKQIGDSYLAKAFPLEVIPTTDDTSYLGRYFKWWKAAPQGDSSVEYGPEKKMQIKTTFNIYPDVSQSSPLLWFGYMGYFNAGTLTGASVGPATAGMSNVGNGTVGSFIANDQFTHTETWTITCIKAGGTGVGLFSVAGTVTGQRGNATSNSAYLTNVIVPSNSEAGFTITAGGTNWSVGDTFTIPAVAANYT